MHLGEREACVVLRGAVAPSLRCARRGTAGPGEAVGCPQPKPLMSHAAMDNAAAMAFCSYLLVVSFVHGSSQELDPSV